MDCPTGHLGSEDSQAATIVEFTGVTGVGKTTLVAAVRNRLADEGLVVAEAYEVVLRNYGLAFIHQPILRSVAMDVLTFLPGMHYMVTDKRGFALLRLALREIRANVHAVLPRANLLRNFLKKIGTYRLLHRMQQRTDFSNNYDVVLWDEGVLQIIHILFVHAENPPNLESMRQFNSLTLQPDISVWVAADPERSIQCTLQRGHKRVQHNPESVRTFIEHACLAFEILFASEESVIRPDQLLKVYVSEHDSQPYESAAVQISRFLINKACLSST